MPSEKHEIFGIYWIFPCPGTHYTIIYSSRRNKPMVWGLDHSSSQPFNFGSECKQHVHMYNYNIPSRASLCICQEYSCIYLLRYAAYACIGEEDCAWACAVWEWWNEAFRMWTWMHGSMDMCLNWNQSMSVYMNLSQGNLWFQVKIVEENTKHFIRSSWLKKIIHAHVYTLSPCTIRLYHIGYIALCWFVLAIFELGQQSSLML